MKAANETQSSFDTRNNQYAEELTFQETSEITNPFQSHTGYGSTDKNDQGKEGANPKRGSGAEG